MGRHSAGQLRDLAQQALQNDGEKMESRASELRRIAEAATENAARRRVFWQRLYLSGINGDTSSEIANLSPEDVDFFQSLGFSVHEVFCRVDPRSKYVDQLASLEREISMKTEETYALDEDMARHVDDDKVIENHLLAWLEHNQDVAFACDMDGWFDCDRDQVHVSTLADLEALESYTLMMRDEARSPERIRALKRLLGAIEKAKRAVGPAFDEKKAEAQMEALEQEISALQAQVAEIEEHDDFRQEGSIRNLYELSWGEERPEGAAPELDSYSYDSLCWMSSATGQQVFKSLDRELLALARDGCYSMEFDCVFRQDGIILTRRSSRFEGYFPSRFDFNEALSLLGYKVQEKNMKEGVSKVVVRW